MSIFVQKFTGLLLPTILTVAFVVLGFNQAWAKEMTVFELELKDGVITPNRLEVKAGTTFKIILKNTGTSAAEFESLRIRKEKVLGPGVTSFVVIRRLSPGTYKFYDEFHLDKETAHGIIVAK